MYSKACKANRPARVGHALFLPFPIMIGGFALTLTLACLSVGIDPAPIVRPFLADAIVGVAPLAGKLFVVWLAYFAAYYLAASYIFRLGSLARNTEGRDKLFSAWTFLYLYRQDHQWDGLWQFAGLSILLHARLFHLPHSCWQPGSSPHLE